MTVEMSIKQADGLSFDLASAYETLEAILSRIPIFDAEYYCERYPDIVSANMDPFEHYLIQGYKEDRNPNPFFDARWYRQNYMAEAISHVPPLFHYLAIGDALCHWPNKYFNAEWYRAKYDLTADQNTVLHYYENRLTGASPMPEFDAEFYMTSYPDIAAAKIDPFLHFWNYGYKEDRDPSATFSTKFYIRKYLNGEMDLNPLQHFVENRNSQSLITRPTEDDGSVSAQIRRFTQPGQSFEEFRPLPVAGQQSVLVLAYYLTQFHAFPENDKWWGKGFTEWTNIARGVPRFKGHYQPRVPRDLGFYSLLQPEVMRAQIALASAAGITGFCFYYYWFDQKRLMERPLDAFLADPSLNMPFCLMWANENWTRRWDGLDAEVLIAQSYSQADEIPFLNDLARHFADPRYIRLNDRPLFFVYRPSLIPNCRTTVARWRSLLKQHHGVDPLFFMAQAFMDNDPTEFDFDGAIEFPPHKLTSLIPETTRSQEIIDDSFEGKIYSYDDLCKISLEENATAYPLIKTAVPSWDNDARRQGKGLIVHGSTPDKYEAWLAALLAKAREKPIAGRPIVCINAWNEWCEGAYLEPDLHFGAAYLNATSRAIAGRVDRFDGPRILLVGHDAFPSGAQQLLLHIGSTLAKVHGIEIEFLLLGGGELMRAYEELANVCVCTTRNEIINRVDEYWARGFRSAICNTSASGIACHALSARGMLTTLLIHELPGIVAEKGLASTARSGLESATQVVFPSKYVSTHTFNSHEGLRVNRAIVRPQGSYKNLERADEGASEVRGSLGLGDEPLVLGIGYADLRKGFDIFLNAWRLANSQPSNVHFCWLGNIDGTLEGWLKPEIEAAIKTGTFHMPGQVDNVAAFLSSATVLALPSREDPFPTVALESLSLGVPVVAFSATGGIPELLEERAIGSVVPRGDVLAFTEELLEYCFGNPASRPTSKQVEQIRADFNFEAYVRELIELSIPGVRWVSAVIPNYNYERHLLERMNSVFAQTYPVQEVIVLDDASVDASVQVISNAAAAAGRECYVHLREENSGSVFAQWEYGAREARGEFVWIAEADDVSDHSFLRRLVAAMEADDGIVLSFTDSRSVDDSGLGVFPDYKAYYRQVDPDGLEVDSVFDGEEFVRRFLFERNVILNVSSVLWRRAPLIDTLSAVGAELKNFKMAGDWRLYIELLLRRGAKVAYVSDPLNVHRRHSGSVTHALKAQTHVAEVGNIHKIVRERLGLGWERIARQNDYVTALAKQLGLVQ